MAGNDVVLTIKARDQASKKLEKVGKTADNIAGKFGKMGKAGAIGVAAIGTAAALTSVKMAADFSKGMGQVRTLIPKASKEAFGQLNSDVLKFSRTMNVNAQDATRGLYDALSAGVPQDNVLTFMDTAAKAATAGASDLQSSVGVLSQIVNVYGAETINAQKASDILFTVIKQGVTTLPQLSQSISTVLPSAAALGVSFEDIASQVAIMTQRTGDTAGSMTKIQAVMTAAMRSSSKLNIALKDNLNKSFTDLIAEGRSTSEIMQTLRESMTDTEFRDLFTRVEALNGALLITGDQNAPAVTSALQDMNEAAGATTQAFGLVKESLGFQIDQSINDVKISLIELGEVALPAIARGIGLVADGVGFLVDAVDAFNALPENIAQAVLPKRSGYRGEAGSGRWSHVQGGYYTQMFQDAPEVLIGGGRGVRDQQYMPTGAWHGMEEFYKRVQLGGAVGTHKAGGFINEMLASLANKDRTGSYRQAETQRHVLERFRGMTGIAGGELEAPTGMTGAARYRKVLRDSAFLASETQLQASAINDMVAAVEQYEEHQLSVNSQVSILKDDLGGLREASRIASETFGVTAEKSAELAAIESEVNEAMAEFNKALLDGSMSFEDVQTAWAKQVADAAAAIENIRVTEDNKAAEAIEELRIQQAKEADRQMKISKIQVSLMGKSMEEIAGAGSLVGMSAAQVATVFQAAQIRSIRDSGNLERYYTDRELDERFGEASATNWARATVEETQKAMKARPEFQLLENTFGTGNYLARTGSPIFTGQQHKGEDVYLTINVDGEVFYSGEIGQKIAEAVNKAGAANGVGGQQMLTNSEG